MAEDQPELPQPPLSSAIQEHEVPHHDAPSGARRPGMLSLTIRDKHALYAAFMPQIRNGGLFIPTARTYSLGDEVFMVLTLMEETERMPVAGKIVWITPRGAQGNRAAGIGIQFSDEDKGATKRKIEGYLGGMLHSEQPTHTM